MDVETENVLKLLFPDSVPERWRENPDFALYLSKLGSYGIEQLCKEPERLGEEKAAILEQTQDLVFTNYKTFIHTAECSREIFKEFSNVEERLNMLIERLPQLSQHCQAFSQASNDIAAHRRLNSLTLMRSAQLLEVLELPQLMDSCVHNGSYEEALELAGYVRRLGKKHGNIPIIASIVEDVEASWLTMLQQLLAQLRSDLALPKCLQVVGFLRRMQLFSEPELRLKFLQARDSWLQSLLSSIPTSDPNHHLSKTIELSRIHLFNIVTQYRAIFSDDEPVLLSGKDHTINESAIFYSWISEKIAQFLATLEKDLALSRGSSLDSIVGQCMYFGLSFSRVGADFRGLLAPIFVHAVSQNFEMSVHKATKKFEHDMDNYALPKTPSVTVGRNISGGSGDHKPEIPPQSILDFYPLAEYCNNLLTAFNDLRLCAPIAVAQSVTEQIQLSLSAVVARTAHFHWQESQVELSTPEKEALQRFCTVLAVELVPYMQRCLHLIFTPTSVATHLGVLAYDLQKEGITYLDQAAIVQPLQHVLPVAAKGPIVIPTSSGDALSIGIKVNSSTKDSNMVVSTISSTSSNVIEPRTDTVAISNEYSNSNTLENSSHPEEKLKQDHDGINESQFQKVSQTNNDMMISQTQENNVAESKELNIGTVGQIDVSTEDEKGKEKKHSMNKFEAKDS